MPKCELWHCFQTAFDHKDVKLDRHIVTLNQQVTEQRLPRHATVLPLRKRAALLMAGLQEACDKNWLIIQTVALPWPTDQEYLTGWKRRSDGTLLWTPVDVALSVGGSIKCDIFHEDNQRRALTIIVCLPTMRLGEHLMRLHHRHDWERLLGGEMTQALAYLYVQLCFFGTVMFS